MPSFKKHIQNFTINLILADFRSIQNTASMFRIADSIGVSKIYLTGTSPTPRDKYNRLRNDFIKISLGSENISHEYTSDFTECIQKLKQDNFHIIGIEQDARSIDYKNFSCDSNLKYALVLFNEPYGADDAFRNLCDSLLEIPQHGDKESLNVTSAGSIALYSLFDK